MQARYYDPVIGRFYSNDPVGFEEHLARNGHTQGFNRYSYVRNNPYKYVDPDGRIDYSSWYQGGIKLYQSQGKTATEFSNDVGLTNMKAAKTIAENVLNPTKKVGLLMDAGEIAIEAVVKEDLPISELAGKVTSEVAGVMQDGIESDFGGNKDSLKSKGIKQVIGKVVDTMTQKAVEPIEEMVEKNWSKNKNVW